MKTLFTFILFQLGLGTILLFFNHISIFESICLGVVLYGILLTNTELDPTMIIIICVISAMVSIGLQRTKVGLFLLAPLFSLFWGWWFSYLIFTDSGNLATIERYIVWGGFYCLRSAYTLHLIVQEYRKEGSLQVRFKNLHDKSLFLINLIGKRDYYLL